MTSVQLLLAGSMGVQAIAEAGVPRQAGLVKNKMFVLFTTCVFADTTLNNATSATKHTRFFISNRVASAMRSTGGDGRLTDVGAQAQCRKRKKKVNDAYSSNSLAFLHNCRMDVTNVRFSIPNNSSPRVRMQTERCAGVRKRATQCLPTNRVCASITKFGRNRILK